MLVNFLKKSLNIILLNIKKFFFFNYFIISDAYLHIYVAIKENFSYLKFFEFIKYCSFLNLRVLLDIKCEDICFFSERYRYKITYVFLTLYYNVRVFFSIFLEEHQTLVSLLPVFNSAEFLEREVWDEFGVNFHFKNKKINRRLLTDYGFKGHPLKKNFPLTGFFESVYFFENSRIKNTFINLLQEYRSFTFLYKSD